MNNDLNVWDEINWHLSLIWSKFICHCYIVSKLDSLQDKWIKDDEVPGDKSTAKNKIVFGIDLSDKRY